MDKITVKAPAKINLTLDVLGRRENGYHDLRMIMQTIDLCDEVTIEQITAEEITLSMNKELPDGCPMQKNLVYRAAILMKVLRLVQMCLSASAKEQCCRRALAKY